MAKEKLPTKAEMLYKIAQMYGLENEWTIWFFKLADELNDDQLFHIFIMMTCEGVWQSVDEQKNKSKVNKKY